MKMFIRRRIWGWICVASIAAVGFSALDALLQDASSSKSLTIKMPGYLYAGTPNSFPAGFSGVVGTDKNSSLATVYATPIFNEVVSNFTSQSPIQFNADGCPDTANSWCNVTFPGIGFQYSCTASRRAADPIDPPIISNTTDTNANSTEYDYTVYESTFFGVSFRSASLEFDFEGDKSVWSIELEATWKDQDHLEGEVMAYRTCTLTPAIVEYPINITGGIANLTASTSNVTWTADSYSAGQDPLAVDKVLKVLPPLWYDQQQNDLNATEGASYNAHSTLGGIAHAFVTQFGSSIKIDSNWDVILEGALASQYALFSTGDSDGLLNNTFNSPMDTILTGIRDIMFRSSIAIVQNDITSYNNPVGELDDYDRYDNISLIVQSKSRGDVHSFETVYVTNRWFLTIAMVLMLFSLAGIMPLYRGYWKLGRKVSLSPFEIAKALHHSQRDDMEAGMPSGGSVLDTRGLGGSPPQAGSNYADDELIAMLGHTKVRFGEVAPNTLGIGLYDRTMKPRSGAAYR